MTPIDFKGIYRRTGMRPSRCRSIWTRCCGIILLLFLAGCAGQPTTTVTEREGTPYASSNIQVGDIVKISFPGAPNLNTAQTVRLDGTVALPLVGNLKAEGKSPSELEQDLLKLYGAQLVVKEVSVSVDSQGYPVFVTGAVLKPGKITCTRSMTVLEAIMEAGGFDPNRANLKKVQVVRKEDGSQKSFVLDLKETLSRPQSAPFYLRPSDIVYVPERFAWY